MRLAQVEVGLAVGGMFFDGASQAAYRFVQFPGFGVRHAERVEVDVVAAVKSMRLGRAFDALARAAAANCDQSQHVPGLGVARVQGNDAAEEAFGRFVVLAFGRAGCGAHQCRELRRRRASHCGVSLKVLALFSFGKSPAVTILRGRIQ